MNHTAVIVQHIYYTQAIKYSLMWTSIDSKVEAVIDLQTTDVLDTVLS